MSSFKGWTPPPTGTIVWTNIGALDIGRAKAFYGEVFSWTFADTSYLPEHIRPNYAPYKPGPKEGAPVGAITKVTSASLSRLTTPNPGTGTLYFIVEDLESTMKKIVKHGGKEASEAIQVGVDYLQHFEDSEGNYAGLFMKG